VTVHDEMRPRPAGRSDEMHLPQRPALSASASRQEQPGSGSWKGVVAGAHLARHLAGARTPPEESYDVDVIILSLDRTEETCAAIASALGQTGVSRHIVVIDQGSRPAGLKKLIAYVEGRSDVTLLAAWRNLGVPGGRNLATGFGHGRIIAALDNDAEFASPDLLAGAAAAFDGDPTLGVVACRIMSYGTNTDDLSSWGYPSRLLPHASGSFDAATFVGAGHAIRRAAWDQAGCYDESLFFCWEEFDFALRAISAGWRIRYRGDLIICHKVSGEHRVGWSDQRWFQHVRNRLYIGHKYGQSWIALSPRIAAYLLKGLRNGLLRESIRAVVAAIRLGASGSVRRLPRAARAYLKRTDGANRGSLIERLRNEVLAIVPRRAATERPSANTLAAAGLSDPSTVASARPVAPSLGLTLTARIVKPATGSAKADQPLPVDVE
jgi:GT2 family glycosyltransferase